MYLNDLGFLGIKLPRLKPSIKQAGKIASKTNPIGGFFSFLNNTQDLAQRAIDARIQFATVKQAWRNPLGLPNQIIQTQAAAQSATPITIEQISQVVAKKVLTNRKSIAELQQNLNALGFSTGAVDGLYGPNTRAGIISFQRANGLTPDGLASDSVLMNSRAMLKRTPTNPTAIPNNPSAPIGTSVPQAPTGRGSGTLPYYAPPPQIVTVTKTALPNWAIPAGIGAAGLLMVAMMGNRR